jgi:hypothetical protein
VTKRCCLCDSREVNPHDASTWKEVVGFVGGPKKDSMVGRHDTNRFACTPCIEKLKAGQPPDQEELSFDV